MKALTGFELTSLLKERYSFTYKLSDDLAQAMDLVTIQRRLDHPDNAKLKYERKAVFVPVLNVNGYLLPLAKNSFEEAKKISTTSQGQYHISIQGIFLEETVEGIMSREHPDLFRQLSNYESLVFDNHAHRVKNYKDRSCQFNRYTEDDTDSISIEEFLIYQAKAVFSVPAALFNHAITYKPESFQEGYNGDLHPSVLKYLTEVSKLGETIDTEKIGELFFEHVFTPEFIKGEFEYYSRTYVKDKVYERLQPEFSMNAYEKTKTDFITMMKSLKSN